MTNRTNRIWSRPVDGFTDTYVNNRNQNWYWQYDADGRVTRNDNGNIVYDAAGNTVTTPTYVFRILGWGDGNWYLTDSQITFDGDGNPVKQIDAPPNLGQDKYYFIRSSVLGGAEVLRVSEIQSNYTWKTTSIYVNGAKIARSYDGNAWHLDGAVGFEYSDPITGTTYLYSPGQGGCCAGTIETDPLGQEVGTYDPGPEEYGDIGQYPEPHEFGNADDPRQGCEIDGIRLSTCSELARFANSGALRFRVQWYRSGSGFLEDSFDINVELGRTGTWIWNPVSGRPNPISPPSQNQVVNDGDAIKVETWGDGGIWEYVELFSLLPQTNPPDTKRPKDLSYARSVYMYLSKSFAP
jgi:hypothetical protein